ncbi:hypothetical protein FHS18_004861 [Paenibacillus phyllosphaerae]|uniref:Uncharacterized protein n=1 Tax=Paenibacillus phyllosphaerae TaxID=274593 RepID=A0A7W5B1J8_9BACL|nr:hypothetical protein [Paenibacillus phyllosphaerae]MBB3112759.1 hypothetical protein [Paenibacillus phyllosphaerae]
MRWFAILVASVIGIFAAFFLTSFLPWSLSIHETQKSATDRSYMLFRESFGLSQDPAHLRLAQAESKCNDSIDRYAVPMTSVEIRLVQARQMSVQTLKSQMSKLMEQSDLQAAYAGTYVNNKIGGLHVGFVDDEAGTIRNKVKLVIPSERLMVWQADYTLAELEAKVEWMNEHLDQLREEGFSISGYSIDVKLNRIEVTAPTEKENERNKKVLSRYLSEDYVVYGLMPRFSP